MVDKVYNDGQWSKARFHSFIVSALRNASIRWGPKYSVKKAAWVSRGVYRCVGYKTGSHNVPASVRHKGSRVNNAIVDHIIPVIDPSTGFKSWDLYIKRMFVEREGFQVLCRECHARKTQDERNIKKAKNE